MTISSESIKAGPFSGNDSTTVFSFTFKCFSSTGADLKVILTNSSGVDTTLSLTTDYTVSLNANQDTSPGGSITTTGSSSPPDTGEKLTILNEPAYTQGTDLITGGGFYPDVVETALDRSTVLARRAKEQVGRSVQIPVSDSAGTTVELPTNTLRANKALVFDADGDVGVSVDNYVDQAANASASATTASTAATAAQSAASAVAIPFLMDTGSTTMSDPAGTNFRLNNATVSSVSLIAFGDTSEDGVDVSDYLMTWDDSTSTINGHLILVQEGTPANWAVFTVGAMTDNSDWVQCAVTHVDSGGSLFTNDTTVRCQFIRAGDKGDTGSTGATGSGEGLEMTFETATTDADQGVGKVWLNHATPGSATIVYMDDVDANSANINSFVDTWDDSASAVKGRIIMKKKTAPENYMIFSFGGSVTSASTYSKAITCTHVVSAGTIADGDAVFVTFSRTGDKGDTGTAATVAVGSVTPSTVTVGNPATAAVVNAGSSSAATLNFSFGIPVGATGATGAIGPSAGLDMVYESTTTDTDQGAGKVFFNHGTLSSATVLYMDDVDSNAASINSYVDSWDDSTTTALRGTVTVTKQSDAAVFAIYNVTGAVTSASTYSKIPVSYITGAGSFTDADACTVQFVRTGNTGSAGSSTPADNVFRIQDNSDATKQIAFEASSVGSGVTRTITMPNSDVTLVSSGAIVNADINGSAAIALSKLATDPSNASNLASGTVPDARISSSSVTQHVTSFDDSDIRSDILKLALHQAIDGNRVAYNLEDSFVDGFEDDTGITTETNVDRNTSGEYVSSSSTTVTTPSASSDWVGATGSASFSSGSVLFTASDVALRSNATISGDFEFESTASTAGSSQGHFPGVFPVSEVGTFSSSSEMGAMTSMTNSYYGSWNTRAGTTEGVMKGSSSIQAHTLNHVGTGGNADVFKIKRVGSTLTFYQNGTLIHTVTGATTADMYICIGGGGNGTAKSQYTSMTWTTYSVSATGTLISDPQTASTSRTSASGVIIYEDGAGTSTLGTDLEIHFTANNGTNWTEAASYGTATTYSGTKKLVKLGATTVTAGTQVAMKAVWANQSGSKEARLHGWAVSY